MHKVFHFANKPAFPLRDGGCVAISSILKSLLNSSEVDVYHFTLATHKHPFDIQAYPIAWLQNMKINSTYIDTEPSALGVISHLFKNKSYNIARFFDKKVAKTVADILDQNDFKTAILESIYLLPYLNLFKERNIKVIVRTHNVEHKLWESLAKNTPSLPKKWYFNRLTKQLKQYELTKCAELDGIISITEQDALFFQQFEPHVMTTSIPPIVNPSDQAPDYELSDFYFLGAMDWSPNIEGIDWFLNEVIPEGIKGSQFYLAGKSLDKELFKHISTENIGEVENAIDFIQKHGICVIPLRVGGGLKIKLLENMALGKPIITTSEGIRGVGVSHEKEVLVADDPTAFRDLMYRLNLDKELRIKLGTNAKIFIQNNFSEEKLTSRLIAFIKDI